MQLTQNFAINSLDLTLFRGNIRLEFGNQCVGQQTYGFVSFSLTHVQIHIHIYKSTFRSLS